MMKIALFLSLASVVWARGVPDDVGIKINNGTAAYPGQFPYQVAIRHKRFGSLLCGGALIHPSWVVTHAFYYGSPEISDVILGVHDYTNFESGQPEFYNIQQAIREPGGAWIVLLKLDRPVAPGNPYIQTIDLAPNDDFDYVGGNCYFSGWKAHPNIDVLQYAEADVVSEENCPTAVNYVTDLCSVDENAWTSVEDMGGPLACRRDGQTYLVGTLHFATYDYGRSLYVRISYYSDWIKAVISLLEV